MSEKRIAVLSDTHIPDSMDEMPASLIRELGKVDLIVHLGDFTDPRVLQRLKSLGEVRAVWGNCDPGEIRRRLPEKDIVEIGGKRIGLVHGSGPPTGIEFRVWRHFESDGVDLILFGHSHTPYDGEVGGVRMINPGCSAETLSSYPPTFAVVTLGTQIRLESRELA